ncbi:MAG: helicase-exonuclease AddAB subunit AddA [Veillonella sp.]|uniref:helicase-exonuclease AddAB subunit AddA n=1 Tax=Veillonella sp. TaxID=1926307 RepID=UPI0025EECD79|nr:helicase-exonuclease AddAB subunit AddA [Veillonella sp.]MBS4913129.1 helicase-exonuclease AddAB subunit AddA [Veillonella sp.]
MKWTTEQQMAIDAPRPGSRDSQTLLVAAAAGSGKTAVLVERIIQRLQDTERPLSIQELLVVTFTKAAAAEMRARIGAKLSSVFSETNNPYLEEQISLLPSAHISTLHSFCQWVISHYFYRLDIDPTFRIGNESELLLIKSEVLDELLIQAYSDNSYNIYKLADMFGSTRSDDGIKEQILNLHTFVMAQDDPMGWLERAEALYTDSKNLPIQETLWGAYFWERQQELIQEIEGRYEEMRQLIALPEGPFAWDEHVSSVEYIMDALKSAETWDEMVTAAAMVGGHKFKAFRTDKYKTGLQTGAINAGVVSKTSTLGKLNQDQLKGMSQGPFGVTEEQFRAQIEQQLPYIHGLVSLTKAFIDHFQARKKEEGMVDFSDLEHLCLALLRDKQDDGSWAPSEVALELRKQFKEVMVDEYQDTSGVQEAIVNAVSRKDNRFYVGDVKQSIYRFRMANPGLFLEKYNDFGKELDDVERRIDLAKNFRSEANILTFTNFLFRQIMTKSGAELDYGDEEALNPGRYVEDAPEDWVGGPVEMHLIDVKTEESPAPSYGGSEEDDRDELDNQDKEIAFIVEKIQELMAQKKKVQEPDGSFREIMWRDIVILLRSTAGKGSRIVEALRAVNIPAYAEEKTGYFSAIEIKLLISLLQIIDNPEQDLPMAVVLASSFVGMDANELGRLRLCGDGSLWSALPVYAETYDNNLLRQFIARLENWRTYSRRHSVSDLLWTIYEEMNYLEYVSAMPNGLVRRANVMALYTRAKQYESGSFRGLFRFLRFLESLQEAGKDLGPGTTVSEADNVVRVMTIHKSKGLEFPVVFLASVNKGFNTQDLKKAMILDSTSGIGLKGYFEEYRLLYGSFSWLYAKAQAEHAMKSEEERILYVALTRARDKLYITGYIRGLESECKSWVAPGLVVSTPSFPATLIQSGKSYLSWLLMALGRHISGNILRVNSGVEEPGLMDLPDKKCNVTIEIHDGNDYRGRLFTKDHENKMLDVVRELAPIKADPLPQNIAERFDFTYPHEGATTKAAKISVSELKRRFAELEDIAEPISTTAAEVSERSSAEPEPTVTAHPSSNVGNDADAVVTGGIESAEDLGIFGMEPTALTETPVSQSGAQWGTLMHEAMQWLPLVPYTKESLSQALDELTLNGYFTEAERNVLGLGSLYRFFISDLGKRLLASPRIEREWPFSLLFDAKKVYPDVTGEDSLFLQGIIDTVFLEDEEWVLVDYKTDRVTSGDELRRRYSLQLKLYKEALERLTNRRVKEVYIYSFALHDAVSMNL